MISDEWKIVLVGLSKKQLASIPKSILGIERTNNTKELAQIYTAADVFFNPTYEDNYPTTNLEAIACGTPVVTYDTGGSPESAGETALVLDKGEVDSVLCYLNSMLNNTFLNNHFNVSKEQSAVSYIKLYSSNFQ